MPKNDYIGQNTKQEVFERFAAHVSSGKARFFEFSGIDFVLGAREGPYLWDLDGQRCIIDCHCNGGVFNLGHRNPEIISTLVHSLKELDIGNHHLVSEQRALLAETLTSLMPGNLDYTVFSVGGGEAIDLAIKIARGYTGRARIISAKGGYHGHTGLALAAGDAKYRALFGPMAPGFEQVPFNDIGALEQTVDERTAAVILETIPATHGIVVPTEDYLVSVRELCDKMGAIFIVDEVQTGLGRTGRLWALDHYGIVPDILVIGKGLSGGIYPIAATSFNAQLEAVFHDDPFIHVSTFGGAEVGCSVALKVIEISSSRDFLDHVCTVAEIFRKGFEDLQKRHGTVLIGLRQLGLMMGIEMVNEMCGPLFTKAAFDSGLLSVYANNDTRVAQLLPPLNIELSLAEDIIQRVDKALNIVKAAIQTT